MSVSLTVNNFDFDFPSPGDPPGWGADVTGWAEEITEVVNNIQGPNDIVQTTFAIANNQSSFTNVTGLLFNTSTVKSAEISYFIIRESDTNPTGFVENGTLYIAYNEFASDWTFSQDGGGDAQVQFQITSGGQVQYKSSDIGSAGYSGSMEFRAKTLDA